MSIPIVAVVGATAAGKTGLSLDLAAALSGEIVNTDALQVYRGMDIGTAKVPLTERRGIPHHLLDLYEVIEPLSVADLQQRARDLVAELRAAGRPPVLVGGSALYIRAILDRFEIPATDPAVRARLEAELAQTGPETLHGRLAELDPEAAARILPSDGRRIVRALEVVELTGGPFRAALPRLEYADPDTVQIGVDIDRPALEARIEERVGAMFAAGLADEVAGLVGRGLLESRTAAMAIGYREVADALAGRMSMAEAQELVVRRTRRFARRQDSWFRKDPRIVWIRYDDPERLPKALAAIRTLGG